MSLGGGWVLPPVLLAAKYDDKAASRELHTSGMLYSASSVVHAAYPVSPLTFQRSHICVVQQAALLIPNG